MCVGGVVGGRGSDRASDARCNQFFLQNSDRTQQEPPPFPSGNRNQGAAPGHGPHWISSGSAFQKMGHGPQTNTNTCFYSRDGGLVDTLTRTGGKRVRLTEQETCEEGPDPLRTSRWTSGWR